MSVVIMRGIPGSGKTTWAEKEASRFLEDPKHSEACIVSADDYFIVNGNYNFDVSKLGEAHQDCFRRFMAQVVGDTDRRLLIVDNTNIRIWECAPYVLAGEAFGHDVKLVRFIPTSSVAVVEAGERNTHGVPLAVVQRMHYGFEDALPHWNEETITISLPQ